MNEVNDSIENQIFEIPKWLKYFAVLFTITGVGVPIVILLNIIGFETVISIYGLNSNSIFHWSGILIVLVFSIKFLVSYGVLKRRKWSFRLAITDAFIGILICIFNFGIFDILTNKSNVNFELRLEIFLLVPYLIYLLKTKSKWESFHRSK
jgi:uncharacterized membrane protein YagU involved in acid resistance